MATKRKPAAKKKRTPAKAPKKTILEKKVRGKKPVKKKKPQAKMTVGTGTADLIRRAETEFIKDEEGRGVDWHYENGEWNKYVAIDTFRAWSKKYQWVSRRVEYWENIQRRLLDHLADKILDQKLKQLGELQDLKDAVFTMLQPVRDKDGKIVKDPDTKLPKFAVDLPPFDRLVKAFLDLDNRIALRTGDVTQRIDVVEGESQGQAPRQLFTPEEASGLMRISPEEAQVLARKLLMDRNSHLEDDVIDAEYEEEADDAL